MKVTGLYLTRGANTQILLGERRFLWMKSVKVFDRAIHIVECTIDTNHVEPDLEIRPFKMLIEKLSLIMIKVISQLLLTY